MHLRAQNSNVWDSNCILQIQLHLINSVWQFVANKYLYISLRFILQQSKTDYLYQSKKYWSASHAVFFHWCNKCSVIKLLACLWQPPGRCNTSDHQGLLASTVNVKQQIQRVWFLLLSLAFRLCHCLPPWTPTSDGCRQYDVIPGPFCQNTFVLCLLYSKASTTRLCNTSDNQGILAWTRKDPLKLIYQVTFPMKWKSHPKMSMFELSARWFPIAGVGSHTANFEKRTTTRENTMNLVLF